MPATIASYTAPLIKSSVDTDKDEKPSFTTSRVVTLSEAVSSLETVRALVLAEWPIGSAGEGGTVIDSISIVHLGPLKYEAIFSYVTPEIASASGGGGGAVDFVAMVRYGKWALSKPAVYDGRLNPAANNPNGRTKIANVVGDRFTPPFQTTRYYPTISIDYIAASADLANLDLCGAVNGSSFTLIGKTFKPFCVMFTDYSVEQIAAARFKQTYTFALNFEKAPPGHDLNGETITGFIEWVANLGLNKLDGVVKVPIYLNNERITEPVMLDALGEPIADSGHAGVYLDFCPMRATDLNTELSFLSDDPYA